MGAHYDSKKGSTSVRRWQTDTSSKDYRTISYSAWRLLLLYAGIVTVDDGLKAIERGAYKQVAS